MPMPDGLNLAVVGVVGTEDGVVERKVVGVTWVGINDETISTSTSTDSDVSDYAIVTGIVIAARASKASVKQIRITREFTFDDSVLNPVDDSAGSLSRVLTLNFRRILQNQAFIRKFEIPAPSNYLLDDRGAFNQLAPSPGSSGGVTIPSAATLLDEVDDMFPNYSFLGSVTGQRKYRMSGMGKRPRSNAKPGAVLEDAGIDQDGTDDVT